MPISVHEISADGLSIDRVAEIIRQRTTLTLSASAKEKTIACRRFLEAKTSESDQLYYGINTGFGSLCNIRISKEETELLQKKLVLSHACGLGEEVPRDIIKIILLLKIQSLSLGHSGVRLVLIERLIDFYNLGILPVIFQLGSLGASGDLAPLAHLGLPLMGEGEVYYQGKRQATAQVLQDLDLSPLTLQSKEGIALLNGTQFSTGYALWSLAEAKRLMRWANMIAAMSIDAFDCRLEPFDARLHQVRPHQGQIRTAQAILKILSGSAIAKNAKKHVQDPYAFRCVPQVHGASWTAIQHAIEVVTTEINAVTDNPNIFADSDGILSGGNFHAQPIALVLDYLGIALAELGSISERRIFQLISGQRDLPPYLVQGAGLDSGYMIAQYAAASVASQNKQLATPASVDSIVSCNGQEDHVSMAANAGTKTYRIVKNLERILAIELMIAAQALSIRTLKSSPKVEALLVAFRQKIPTLQEDRWLHPDIEQSIAFMDEYEV